MPLSLVIRYTNVANAIITINASYTDTGLTPPSKESSRRLWSRIIGILPYYDKRFKLNIKFQPPFGKDKIMLAIPDGNGYNKNIKKERALEHSPPLVLHNRLKGG